MRLSQLVAMLVADLETNGDAENVMLGVVVTGADGEKYRLDTLLAEPGDISILRDSNYTNGMAVFVADYTGPHEVIV